MNYQFYYTHAPVPMTITFFLCGFGNIAPPCGVARTLEIMSDGIGKDIGFAFAFFLRVLLGG